MKEDFCTPKLQNFINTVLNPMHDRSADLMQRYRRLHAALYYFEYSVGMVRNQEAALQNKNSDATICGSAIAAYVFMYDCFVLFESAINSMSKEKIVVHEIKNFIHLYSPLKQELEDIRHSLGAHPEGIRLGTEIATKRSMVSTDGRVRIGKWILHPRKKLEALREYLERIGGLLYENMKEK